MKIPEYLLAVLAALMLTSCIDDFDSRRLPEMDEPSVVVSCFLHQYSNFNVELMWSKAPGSIAVYSPVTGASVKVYENDNEIPLVLPALDTNSGIYHNGSHYPEYGNRYRLVIDVPGYDKQITAETSIPEKPSCNISYVEIKHNDSNGAYYPHFTFQDMALPVGVRSMWITGQYGYEGDIGTDSNISRLFPNTADTDHVNMYLNNYLVAFTGSNMQCDYFVRIPKENLRTIGSFNLCAEISVPYKEIKYRNPITGEVESSIVIADKIAFELISPSEEYDRYCRSVYKQLGHRYDPGSPFIDNKTIISGNIKNGLGVFAGYSYRTEYFRISNITEPANDE